MIVNSRKSISRIFLLFCFMLSFSIWAEDDNEKLALIMSNTGNQFIYAFFGKQVLIDYINDVDDKVIVSKATMVELEELSKPFNSKTFLIFGLLLTAIYYFILAYFLIRLFLFLIENTWIYLRDKEPKYNINEYVVIATRIVLLGVLFLVPVQLINDDAFFKTSLYNRFFFMLAGKTSSFSDESMKELINSQSRTISTVKMPKADVKLSSGMALNQFFTCLRINGNSTTGFVDEKLVLYLNQEKNSVRGVINHGQCNLHISFGYDSGTDQIIKRINKNKDSTWHLLLADDSYQKAQKMLIIELLDTVFKQTTKISGDLVSPYLAQSNLAFDFSTNKPKEFQLAKFTKDTLSQKELTYWESRCDKVMTNQFAYLPKTDLDKKIYYYLSSRCLSYEMAKKIVYPKVYDVLNDAIEKGVLKDRQFALCLDEMDTILNGGGARYVTNKNTIDLADVNKISLESCLTKICSEDSLVNGGTYACSSSLSLYEDRLNDFMIKDRGTFILGFYMYKLFTNHSPSEFSKNIYNGTNFTFTESNQPYEPKATDTELLTYPLNQLSAIPSYVGDKTNNNYAYLMNLFKLAEDEDIIDYLYSKNERKHGLLSIVQYARWTTCIKNPLQYVDGYVCNNIPEETNRLGMNILRATIAFKTLLTIGNAMGHTSFNKEIGGIGSNTGVFNKVISSVKGVGFISGSAFLLNDLMNVGFSYTDEFGFLDQHELSNYMKAGGFISSYMMLSAGSNEGIANALDVLLLIALIIGILFAVIIPFFPMILVINALGKYFVLIFNVVFMTGFKLVDAAFFKEPIFLNEKFDKIWADWLAALFKLPLLFIAIVLAWSMSNVVISKIMSHVDKTLLLNQDFQSDPVYFIDSAVMLVISFLILFLIYNMLMSIIESFYDFVVDWLLGKMTISPFVERKAFNFKDVSSVFKTIGR